MLTDNIPGLLVVLALLGIVPALVVLATAYTKIIIVFLIVRNALGVQQMPPNFLLNMFALVLAIAVMGPVVDQILAVVSDPSRSFESFNDWMNAFEAGSQPLRDFLMRYADPEHRAFFLEAVQEIWREHGGTTATDTDLSILIPSFMVSELTRAFEIGFLLYLPFLAIDFAISAILLGLGMQMLSPVIISVPFKLLIFVLVDGWARLVQGLVLSYGVLP
ncbi:MAG: type III secretion system export apparatus subunit SctR [Hyphomicrobiaceae bacterium]|nr:type III secretion system export apparatus subunit SctR [Hyphomicrobiaceae bacterium]